ncbi:UMF1 family MFS transporter [Hydrogenivirga caldilitoris]|uniref:UMF1 family MFS transporter n=1 Tax=Hydrogenivirga caldilitoris TaxID=246264 RepID=A0A497XS06_9AQUI|nr:MFS transporter [Hydrogenivirga caldilitoris]RLJ71064.1 UMF1 family MFS transporter [Hydrogenivirga caldilitoris]
MIKKLSFGLFDTGETILGALVFSTFFPLYITQHISPSLYSFFYGFSFLLSFLLALYLGKEADRRALRKPFFTIFGILVVLLCISVGLSLPYPALALFFFLLMAVAHQQAFVFYNSLLLDFEYRGFTSGLGVALGYVGSALALIFLADKLKEPEVYFVVAGIFFVLLLPSVIRLENPHHRSEVSVKEVFRDRSFLLLILSILTVTEVANTLVAMMGVYLKEVYLLDRVEIYRVIGFSAFGGILGGLLWGKLSDLFGVRRVFPLGFLLWTLFLASLPLAPKSLLLVWGLWAGLSLAHVWTTSRVLILSEFPEGEASIRLSFLSLTERVASTTGLFLWGTFLLLTDNNFPLSACLMAAFPILGLILFWYASKKRLI